MTTLADEFLADLHDLGGDNNTPFVPVKQEDADMPDLVEFNAVPEDINSVRSIARLLGSPELTRVLTEIPKYAESNRQKSSLVANDVITARDPEYNLIVEANELASKINFEIINIHKFIREIYSKKFPELEHQVMHPLDYARVVKKLGNNLSNTIQDLSEVLPQTNIIAISMTASSSSGRDLTPEELNRVFEGCDTALQLDEDLQVILGYVESRMKLFAPNLTEIVGSVTAAKLIGIAGGLDKLAKMPAGNLILLGRTKQTLEGFSTATVIKHHGLIGDCEIMRETPPDLHLRAARLIGNKASLAARLDHTHDSHLNGELGVQLREQIEKKIEKWQEPPPARKEKALPAPDETPRKRRGGQRRKKEKELYAMTELKKRAMRMPFGQITEDFGNTTKSLGVYGMSEGSGKIRANVRDEKGMKIKKKKVKGNQTEIGFATSVFAFTPAQGLELAPTRPSVSHNVKASESGSYFSNNSGFVNVNNQKK